MRPAHRAHLAAPVRLREQTHRRAVVIGIAALTIFSVLPVFGHHVAGRASTLLVGTDHLWVVCIAVAHTLLAPVHVFSHMLIAAGLAYAVWDRARSWRASRRTLGALETQVPAVGDSFWRAARGAELAPESVRIVEGLPVPAMTAGWLRPMVFVARVLAEQLAPEQLVAVLAHEGAHARRHDPLRLSLLRWLTLTLWWLTALRHLVDDVADEAEVRADDEAARDRPLVLASAILALASWGGRGAAAFAVGFQRADLVDRRIRRLAGEDAPVGTHLTGRSLAGAAAALATVWISGLV